jgi:hypothetical protein
VNPLRDYDLGRHAVFGAETSVEFDASVDAGKYFSAYVRPRFEALVPRREDMNGKALLQNGYGVFRAGNFTLQFGRDSQLWGFGDRGSLLFSTNPRPLDGVRITNPTPARLPWIFKYLGEWRVTLYGYNLGPEYQPKWAWLTGYKVSLAPSRWVELGFGHVMEIGGEGVYSPNALDVIGGFFGFRPRGTDATSPQTDNHIFELEALVRIPPARGMQLYGNIAIDDKWKSIKKTLKDGCSFLGGVYFPALTPSGATDLRVEVVRTSALYGHHSLFRDGYAINQKLIGTDAGPDAWTASATLRHRLSPKLWYGLSFGWDYRRSDTYTEPAGANGLAAPVIKVATGPTDVRYRGLADLDIRVKKHLGLRLTAGYERAQDQGFVAGNDVNNFLAAASLTFDFDRRFAFSRD